MDHWTAMGKAPPGFEVSFRSHLQRRLVPKLFRLLALIRGLKLVPRSYLGEFARGGDEAMSPIPQHLQVRDVRLWFRAKV